MFALAVLLVDFYKSRQIPIFAANTENDEEFC